jgi:hypothetical protein
MFKLAVKPTFSAVVAVDFPLEKGKVEKKSFTAIFKRCTQAELEAMDAALKSEEMSDREFLHAVMHGWDGVADEDGNAIEFTKENLELLLDMHPTQPTVIRTFYDTIGKGARKNSR